MHLLLYSLYFSGINEYYYECSNNIFSDRYYIIIWHKYGTGPWHTGKTCYVNDDWP